MAGSTVCSIPAPWARTITELCADGVTGAAYAHEMMRVSTGTAEDFLSLVAEHATDAYAAHGWELVGAWRTAMHDDAECVLIWAIPSWEQWAELEKAVHYAGGLRPGATCSASAPPASSASS